MHLTPAQKKFLASIPADTDPNSGGRVFWECFPEELRTALALHQRGLIEFEGGQAPPDRGYFMARQVSAPEESA